MVRRHNAGFLFFLALGFIAGCSLTSGLPRPPVDSGIPHRAKITSVPFYPQASRQCGPAALAMTLTWSGRPTTPADVLPHVFVPARGGSLQPFLIGAARRHGRLAFVISGTNDLLRELAAGHPVIVLQNLGLSWFPRYHYAVVVGYDLNQNTVTVHSGRDPERRLPWSLFVRTWERAGAWGLVILPPEDLPATADQSSFLSAALALEHTDQWDAAASAYSAALTRWPGNREALMGLGNSRYRLGDLHGSEQAFRRAVQAHPKWASACNNLAHVLMQQDRIDEAMAMARRAVALGGDHLALYRQTLREIEALREKRH